MESTLSDAIPEAEKEHPREVPEEIESRDCLEQIEALLGDLDILDGASHEAQRATCFFDAVNIARQWWDDLTTTDYGRRIIEAYVSKGIVDPKISNEWQGGVLQPHTINRLIILESELRNIQSEREKQRIEGLLKIIESQREDAGEKFGYWGWLEGMEKKIKIPSKNNDYRILVTRVIDSLDPVESYELEEDPEYINHLLKAIDICRLINLNYRQNALSDLDTLAHQIDRILWWVIDREVLHLAEQILLSQNEGVNGSGYPHGLLQKDIPLAGRIYAIIRAYELTSSVKAVENHEAIEIIHRRNNGFFDDTIVWVFSDALSHSEISIKKTKKTPKMELSETKKEGYLAFIEKWLKILEKKDKINELLYARIVDKSVSASASGNLESANILREELIDIANVEKNILFSRHGKDESAERNNKLKTQNGPDYLCPPGRPEDGLIEEWIRSSRDVWYSLRKISCMVSASPTRRTCQTAQIIFEEMRNRVATCLDNPTQISSESESRMNYSYDPRIRIETSLANPDKNSPNYDTWVLWKMMADASDTSKPPQRGFWKQFLSSPRSSTHLFVVHRASWEIAINLIGNLFIKGTSTLEERPFEMNEMNGVRVIRFRWTKIATDTPIFSIENWEQVVTELNHISMDVLGRVFYDFENTKTNPIRLGWRLQDFMDQLRETSPRNFSKFISRIRFSPNLNYLLPLLHIK